MISKTKAKSEMKKEHKLWEKASITDLKKSEKCGEYGEPCLALKNRTCFEGTPCRLCYIGMGYEQGKKESLLLLDAEKKALAKNESKCIKSLIDERNEIEKSLRLKDGELERLRVHEIEKRYYEQGKKDAYKKTLKFVKMYSQNDDVSEIDLIPIMDWLVELSK